MDGVLISKCGTVRPGFDVHGGFSASEGEGEHVTAMLVADFLPSLPHAPSAGGDVVNGKTAMMERMLSVLDTGTLSDAAIVRYAYHVPETGAPLTSLPLHGNRPPVDRLCRRVSVGREFDLIPACFLGLQVLGHIGTTS